MPALLAAGRGLRPTSPTRATSRTTRSRSRRSSGRRSPAARSDRDGQRYAEVAYPIGDSVVLLSASLHDQLRTVAVVRRACSIAGARGVRLRAAPRLRRAPPARPPHPPARGGRRADRRRELRRAGRRRRLRRARPAGAGVRAHAAAARAARPRARRVHRQRLARAAHAALLARRRSSSCSTTPTLDEATRDEFLAQMREQVDRLDEARDRPARPLAARRRPAGGRRASRSTSRSSRASVAREFGPRAAALGHALERVAERARARPRATRRASLQIGRILVENALAAHARRARPCGSRPPVDGGRATLTVADDGPGIPHDARQQVFERFYRLDGTRASGSGLGLAIARELAELMGGRLELDSQDGWTLFTLVLSAEAQDRDREPSPSLKPAVSTWKRPPASYSGREVRPGLLAAVSLVAAVLGGALVLVVAKAAGWLHRRLDDDDRRPASSPRAGSRRAGGRRQAARRQRVRARADLPRALGRGRDDLSALRRAGSPDASAGQGSGFVVAPRRHDPDERPRDHHRRPGSGAGRRARAHASTSSSPDGDRVPATVVGYDLFDDVGVIRVDPARARRSTRCRSATRAVSSSASRSPRSAARSATPTRSRSASSPRSGARSPR